MALMRSYSCFHRSIGEKKCRKWSASRGGGGGGGGGDGRGDGAAAGDGDGDIWLSNKKRSGIRCLAYVATANSLEASSRSSQKMNGGRYKEAFLLLSIKEHDRYS